MSYEIGMRHGSMIASECVLRLLGRLIDAQEGLKACCALMSSAFGCVDLHVETSAGEWEADGDRPGNGIGTDCSRRDGLHQAAVPMSAKTSCHLPGIRPTVDHRR
ncbi:hypothetical protein Psi01_22760 [Planobispora siamensis]|uniref:Uncharacterized protein n=1 Tax=Planobispora siamensis TaxID=936338 RepID=A0A8J3SBH7_9ACTN|nr:hypothetical protein Psi01_22760 [Planobispora siamensis]